MPSINPEAIRNGRNIMAGGAGGATLAGIVFYILTQIHGGGGEVKTAAATVDVKQDMQIQYNQIAIAEVKKDQKEIKEAINSMSRTLDRIEDKLP